LWQWFIFTAAVAKFKTDFPQLSASQLTNQIIGIDIHPLSVQIAKTTLLLTLSDKIRQVNKPVILHVIKYNTSIPNQ
jgi:hypothetical protein